MISVALAECSANGLARRLLRPINASFGNFPFHLACESSVFSESLDHLAVTLRWERAELALERVFTEKRQLHPPAKSFESYTVLPPEVIFFQCLCILAQDSLHGNDQFRAHYGIRLVTSMTRELAGIGAANYFLLPRWIPVIAARTRCANPLDCTRILTVRSRLTVSQAETAADMEGYSHVFASPELYLQAFDFAKALLSVRVLLAG